jgi:hypothetical protein
MKRRGRGMLLLHGEGMGGDVAGGGCGRAANVMISTNVDGSGSLNRALCETWRSFSFCRDWHRRLLPPSLGKALKPETSQKL